MKTFRFGFLLAACAAIFFVPAHAGTAEVLMIPESGGIQPSSTLEFRFPSAVVKTDQLGPADQSPVVFKPELPGSFTWLSTSSGVFSPEGPPPLGTEWQASLRAGIPGTLSAKVNTPPFGITKIGGGIGERSEIPPGVAVRLAFNLPIASDPSFFEFVNGDGVKVPALLRPANGEDYFPVAPEENDWNERWKLAKDPSSVGADEPSMARVVVTPAAPLPVSSGWRLVVKKGLPSAQSGQTLGEASEIAVGNVLPLTIEGKECGNYINSGPTATIRFSSDLAPDITDETADKFFSVTPAVPGLSWEIGYNTAVLRGKFDIGKEYVVRIGDAVVSGEGAPFGGERDVPLSFGAVAPRLYLPELTMSQVLGGRRILPVRSVNLVSLRVRATLLSPEQALRALSVFEENRWKYSNEEPVPTTGFSGEPLADETIAISGPKLDQKMTTDIDWTRILGGKKSGFVYLEVTGEPLAEAGGKKCAAQALVQLTDLGVLWSKAGNNLYTFVFSSATAKPAADASVRLVDEKFATISEIRTDAKGAAKLVYDRKPAWVLIGAGEDSCVLKMGPGAQTLPTGAWFSDWAVDNKQEAGLRAAMFTDRPLYQPGETVRIKGYLRNVDEKGVEFAEGREVRVALIDPEDNEATEASATSDNKGAFDSAVVLPRGPLGRYRLSLSVDGDQLSSESVLLAEYQPDAFEVQLAMPKAFAAGAPAPTADVGGKYFFGGKVTDAEVRWSLRYFQTLFAPEGFEKFQFLIPSEEVDEAVASKPLTVRGEGKITGGGPLEIKPVLPMPSLAPFRGVLTAEVTDLNQQTVSSTAEFTRESSDFYLGINRGEERVLRVGEEVPLQFVAVAPGGKPLRDAVDVKVEIWRWRYNVVRELGAGGAMTFRTETIEEPAFEKSARSLVPTKTAEGWSAGQNISTSFKAAALGHHRVRVTARDSGGREVVSETSFYVSGDGDTVWDYRNPYAIDLIPDKSSYLPGDTVRVLVKTPIEGEAIVNVQRGDAILRSLRLPLVGNAPVIEIPIGKDDAPNVTISLVILRGADESKRKFPMPEFRFGSCDISVEQPERVLKVAIRPDKARVQPGEDIACTIEVRNHNDKPVANAGVTFYAVDDGVVSLVGFKRPDPGEVFLRPVPDRVLIGLSLADLLPEDPDDLEFGNKGYLIGGGGQEGPVALRENFPGTACWLPSLTTGSDGRVTARFAAPDALTRYRLVAVAAAGTDSFGSAESAVEIFKPLMLIPSLGQFANEGDDLIARAVIRNETGSDGVVEVALRTAAGTQNKTLSVASGASAAADFKLALSQPGEMELEWTAQMTANGGNYSDGAKTRLAVGSPMVKLNETYFSQLGNTTNNLLEGVNPQVIEGRGEVSVNVANTRLVSLGKGARYLVEYPYGCAEQKTSSLVPWIVMPVLGPLMPGFARNPEEMIKVIDKTVYELFQLQREDGGLGFWPDSAESSLFASSWAATVLAIATSQSTKLPREWNQLLDYLSKSLRGLSDDPTTLKLADRAFAAYALALAGRPEAAYHEELFRRRADLPRDARAALAMAIASSGGPRDMSMKLLSLREPAPDDTSPFADAVRERAIRLAALTLLEPAGKEIGPLVAEVLKLGAGQRSATTQNSAWTLLALAAYRDTVENRQKGPRNAEGSIIAGADSFGFSVSEAKPASQRDFPVTPGSGASQKLAVDNPDRAPLYGETSFQVYPPLGEQPRQDRGFAVSRSYRKIAPDGSLMPAEDLRVGDRVIVTLRVESTRPAHFVAIDDPLPSILEAVNPEFVSRQSGENTGEDYTPWLSHSETRSDRVLYFCDALPAGAHTFEYLARVRVAGKAAAGATKAEAMYRPERFGLGAIDRLTSEPALTTT